MISIALRRLLADGGACLSLGEVAQRKPANGRQGKSAACCRAQVVGWVEVFGHSGTLACWRSIPKREESQRSNRRRTLLQPISAA
jgi:hypothetical protein